MHFLKKIMKYLEFTPERKMFLISGTNHNHIFCRHPEGKNHHGNVCLFIAFSLFSDEVQFPDKQICDGNTANGLTITMNK